MPARLAQDWKTQPSGAATPRELPQRRSISARDTATPPETSRETHQPHATRHNVISRQRSSSNNPFCILLATPPVSRRRVAADGAIDHGVKTAQHAQRHAIIQ